MGCISDVGFYRQQPFLEPEENAKCPDSFRTFLLNLAGVLI